MRGLILKLMIATVLVFWMTTFQATAQETISRFSDDSINISLGDVVVPTKTGNLQPLYSPRSPNEAQPQAAAASPQTVPMIPVTWASANSHYRRLYFEEKLLERHGLTDGPKRAVIRSTAQFFARAVSFPIYSWKLRPDQFQSPYSLGQSGSEFNR